VLQSDKEDIVVGAECRSAFKLTREQRCVTFRQGGCRWSEQSRAVHVYLVGSGDVLLSDEEDIGGQSRAEDCM
jgi:hypothetical protein